MTYITTDAITLDELRAWRKRMKLSQAQAAEVLGRSVHWYRSAEQGGRGVRIERVVKLACEHLEYCLKYQHPEPPRKRRTAGAQATTPVPAN